MTSRGDRRRASIERAAVEQFSAHGYSRTSMAQIAEAAGVSRPALYQYYADKDAIFAAAFVSLFEELATAAIDALDAGAGPAEALDGFLQRFEGGLWERMAASPYIDEVMAAKSDEVKRSVSVVMDGLHHELANRIGRWVPGRSKAVIERRNRWLELLRFGPKGLKYDEPSVELFRARLSALADAVAADMARVIDAEF